MTGALADEIIRRSEATSKDKELGAWLRDVRVASVRHADEGNEGELLKEIKSFVDRLATRAAQTSSF